MSPFFQQAPTPSQEAQRQLEKIVTITNQELFDQRKVTEWMLHNRPGFPKEVYEKALQEILMLMRKRGLSDEDYKLYLSSKKETVH